MSDEICARACACGTCNIVDGHGAVLFSTEEECRSKVDEYVHNGSRWQCDADLDTAACTTTATPVKDALILPDSCGEGDWSDE